MPRGYRKTSEEFVEEVKALVGDEYTILGTYIKSSVPISIKHNVCGNEFEVRPNSFVSTGTRCPKCNRGGNKFKLRNEQVANRIKKSLGDEYQLVSEYKGQREKIMIKHLTCGHEYKQMPRSAYDGYGCPNCSPTKKKTTKEALKIISDETDGEYTLVSEYINSQRKLRIKHEHCGRVFEVSYANFKHCGTRCTNCRESKGEQRIRRFLQYHGISFSTQKRFKNCRNKNELPFDFSIVYDDKSEILIEFDGKQHFKPTGFFGGEEALKLRKKCDAIKTQYCADNGIPLIRIPYWDFDNIDAILTEKLLPLLDTSSTKKQAC